MTITNETIQEQIVIYPSYTYMREREDGDYDHIQVNSDNSETLIEVIAAADKDYPFGRMPDDHVAQLNRNDRDDLLAKSDWRSLPDSPPMSTEWVNYRQALRDITNHPNWPHLDPSDWPTKPTS